MTRAPWLACLALAIAHAGAAQEFQPPSGGSAPPGTGGGIRIGLFGFSSRAGSQINKGGEAILGTTVDIAQLGSPNVRLRPSFEFGAGRSVPSTHVALEVIYRFQPDGAAAIPYVGAGVGYNDSGPSEQVWPNLVMGFEVAFRPTFNWLLEYHSLDRMGRHRFLVGLSARTGTGGT